MKVLSFLKKNKIITSVIAIAILASIVGISYAAVNNNKSEPKSVAQTATTPKKTEKAATVETEKVVDQTEDVVPVANKQAPAPVVVEQPIILSTQEYAQKYLKLGEVIPGVTGQMCFDALVAAYPNRFNEDVRERNVKALSVYENPCATGYGGSQTIKQMWDYKFPNGSFFDSDLAKTTW